MQLEALKTALEKKGYGAETPAQRPRLAMEELILAEDPEVKEY